jgi:hypothetical protein
MGLFSNAENRLGHWPSLSYMTGLDIELSDGLDPWLGATGKTDTTMTRQA